jgi:hypothetical protein
MPERCARLGEVIRRRAAVDKHNINEPFKERNATGCPLIQKLATLTASLATYPAAKQQLS